MTRTNGTVIEMPVKSNFREGLSPFEYFNSTHGARKGAVDKSLKPSDSGYLMRKLVDVAHSVVVTMHDCGTSQGVCKVPVRKGDKIEQPLAESIRGRISRNTIEHPVTKEVIVRENEMITVEVAQKIEALGMDKIRVRSPMTCRAPLGVCQLCYGMDLSTGALVEEGMAVGIIAAQSIGEPGTQLTMRTFHIGGVVTREAGETETRTQDITGGLPRVTEIFEARTPREPAKMAEVGGVVRLGERKRGKRTIYIQPVDDQGEGPARRSSTSSRRASMFAWPTTTASRPATGWCSGRWCRTRS